MFESPMASVALKTILEKAWSGVRMSRSNLRYLLSIDEHSLFSKYIRQSAAMPPEILHMGVIARGTGSAFAGNGVRGTERMSLNIMHGRRKPSVAAAGMRLRSAP